MMVDFELQGEHILFSYEPAEVEDPSSRQHSAVTTAQIDAAALGKVGHETCIFLRDICTDTNLYYWRRRKTFFPTGLLNKTAAKMAKSERHHGVRRESELLLR